MKLSIVIPVYQVENTLRRCVESVVRQTFDDYEVILIDDGSTDHSAALCDTLAEEDRHIRVIHQRNGGLSAARNTGIEAAQGEYITFIDSDDYLGDGTIAILMSRLGAHPDIDILEYPVYWHHGSKDGQILKFGIGEYTDMDEYWLKGKGYKHAYAWNKIYRKQLFEEVRFPEQRLFEDAYTMPRLLAHAHRIGTTEEGIYYYTCNPDGLSMNPGGAGLAQLLETHVEQLERMGIAQQLTEYYAHVLNIQIDTYAATRQPPILPTAEFRRKEIGALPINVKMKLKLHLLKLIGMKRLCKLFKLIH
ncbi:MAG: glycosyltransferase family 2 protein [Prevotella sp.]|nr:glycosyltransferase family 2 protein [Prevotella sp.]